MKGLKLAWVVLACCLCGKSSFGQSSPNYDSLVLQGKTQLQAGISDAALASANAAIKLDASRWEAYAVAGGALMNVRRYEDAADQFGRAIERAPEPKQEGLRDLRKRCLVAELGAAPAPNQASTPSASSGDSSGPSYSETVRWIQEHIKMAGIPGGTKQRGSLMTVNDDQQYALKVNGCSTLDLIITSHWRITDAQPSPGDSPLVDDYTRTADYRISLAGPPGENPIGWGDIGVGVHTDTHGPTERDGLNPDASVRNVEFTFKRDLVTLSFTNKGSQPSEDLTRNEISILNRTSLSLNDPTPDPHYEAWNDVVGVKLPGWKAVRISYGRPGTEEEPDLMAKALQHLITLCRQNSNVAPKDMF